MAAEHVAKGSSLPSRGDAKRDTSSGLSILLLEEKPMIVENALWLVSIIQTYDSTCITLRLVVDPPSISNPLAHNPH